MLKYEKKPSTFLNIMIELYIGSEVSWLNIIYLYTGLFNSLETFKYPY